MLLLPRRTPYSVTNANRVKSDRTYRFGTISVTCKSDTKGNVSKQCLLYVYPQREDEILQKGN